MNLRRTLAALALTLLAAPLAADTFTIDRAHTKVGFSVRHIVTKVYGNFNEFDGTIELDPKAPASASVSFTVKAASIDTANEKRDGHLRSADFFDVEKFPELSFKSTSVKPLGGDKYEVTGKFTMHGVTKDITVPVSYLGAMKMGEKTKAGFETEFTVNRKDYGIIWNRDIDEGGLLLGDEVTIRLDVEADKVQPAPAAAPAAAPAPAPAKP